MNEKKLDEIRAKVRDEFDRWLDENGTDEKIREVVERTWLRRIERIMDGCDSLPFLKERSYDAINKATVIVAETLDVKVSKAFLARVRARYENELADFLFRLAMEKAKNDASKLVEDILTPEVKP